MYGIHTPAMQPLFTARFTLLLTGQFLQNMAFASLPLVPLLLAHLGASRTDIGVLMAVGGVGGVALRPVVGWALDHVGRWVVLVIATLLTALTVGGLGWIHELGPSLYVNRILFGIGMGAAATAWFTLAVDTVPARRRTEGIALFGIAGLAGLVVNPVAGQLGIDGATLARVFPWLAVVIGLSLVPLLFIRRERGESRPLPALRAPEENSAAGAAARAEEAEEGTAKAEAERATQGGEQGKRAAGPVGNTRPPEATVPGAGVDPGAAVPGGVAGILAALRAPSLVPVWLVTALFAALLSAFLFFASVAAEARGVEWPTHLWFTYAAGAIAVRVVGARLPDRIGPQRLILPSLSLYALGLAVAAEAQTTGGFLLAGLIAGVGHGYFFPCAAALVLARMPDALRGSALAAFTALLEGASLLAAPIFGWLADGWGDALMFRAAALLGAAGIALWWLLERALGTPHQPATDGQAM